MHTRLECKLSNSTIPSFLTMWIRTSLYRMQQLHVADIVYVNLLFQNDNQALAVEFDSENGCGKGEFADGRLALVTRSI